MINCVLGSGSNLRNFSTAGYRTGQVIHQHRTKAYKNADLVVDKQAHFTSGHFVDDSPVQSLALSGNEASLERLPCLYLIDLSVALF